MDNFQINYKKGKNCMNDKYLQLRQGMEFKSYRHLCEFLEVKPATGNAKISHISSWERYFEFERIGNKYRILEVYPIPLFNLSNDGTYANYIQKLFLDLLYCKHMEGMATFKVTAGKLLYLLNMVNMEYLNHRNNYRELSRKLDIEEHYVNNFYYTVSGKLSSTLLYSLKKLKQEKYIIMEEIFTVSGEFGNRRATDRERQLILDIGRKALSQLNCKDEQEVYKTGKRLEYWKLLQKLKKQEKLLEHVKYWYESYEFTFTSAIKDKIQELETILQFDREEERRKLNAMLVENYKESYNKKYMEAVEDYERFLLSMGEYGIDNNESAVRDLIPYNVRYRKDIGYLESGYRLIDHTIKESV